MIYRLGILILAIPMILLGGAVLIWRQRLDGEARSWPEIVRLLGGSWGGSPRPRNPDAELGLILARGDAPGLFADIEQLCKPWGLHKPGQIRIHGLPTCCLVAWGGRADQRALVLGIPLLMVLDRHHLRAIVAHELAHLAGGDAGRLASLIRFANALDREVMEDQRRRPSSSPLRPWAHLGRAVARRLAAPIARAQEFHADAEAADRTDPKTLAEALRRVAVAQNLFDEVARHYNPEQAGRRNLYAYFHEFWRRLPGPLRDELLAQMDRPSTDLTGSGRQVGSSETDPGPHPDLAERLARLDQLEPKPERYAWPTPPAANASTVPALTLLANPAGLQRLLHNRHLCTGEGPTDDAPSVFHRAGGSRGPRRPS